MPTSSEIAAAIDRARVDGFNEARDVAIRLCRDAVSDASPAVNIAITRIAIALRGMHPSSREPGEVAVWRPKSAPKVLIEEVEPDETSARAFAMRGRDDEPGVGVEERVARGARR
jgi:hypothetical protein